VLQIEETTAVNDPDSPDAGRPKEGPKKALLKWADEAITEYVSRNTFV
jgi:hypothetical protein